MRNNSQEAKSVKNEVMAANVETGTRFIIKADM